MSEAEVKMVLPENAFEKLPEDEKNNEFIIVIANNSFIQIILHTRLRTLYYPKYFYSTIQMILV